MRAAFQRCCWIAVLIAMLAPATGIAGAERLLQDENAPGTAVGESETDASDVGVPAATDGRFPYVIVTDRTLAPEFRHLARAHAHAGLAARVRTVQSIRIAYPAGRDDAERIRMFLIDAHAKWGTRWVLLGGDDPLVPERRALLRPGLGAGLDELLLPTDQYYACLDGTWNADGDDQWGEAPNPMLGEPGDDVDFAPELNVGRAPVRRREEARVFVRKTLAEMIPRRRPAQRAILLAAGVQDVGSSIIDFASFTESVAPTFAADPGTRIARLYYQSQLWPGSFPESRGSLLDSLARGYDIAVLAGSGGPGVFVAGAQPNDNLAADELLGLDSHNAASHVYVLSAFTTAPGTLSIGAALMRAPHGGAVTLVGSSDLQFTATSVAFMRAFFEEATREPAPTIGEALSTTIAHYASVGLGETLRLTVQGNLLFGDPALTLPAEAVRFHRGRHEAASAVADLAGAPAPELAIGLPAPNPSSTETHLRLSVPASAAGAPFDVVVLDVTGRRVRRLESGTAPAGALSVTWDLRSDDGARVRDGLYFVRVTFRDEARVFRIVVVK